MVGFVWQFPLYVEGFCKETYVKKKWLLGPEPVHKKLRNPTHHGLNFPFKNTTVSITSSNMFNSWWRFSLHFSSFQFFGIYISLCFFYVFPTPFLCLSWEKAGVWLNNWFLFSKYFCREGFSETPTITLFIKANRQITAHKSRSTWQISHPTLTSFSSHIMMTLLSNSLELQSEFS